MAMPGSTWPSEKPSGPQDASPRQDDDTRSLSSIHDILLNNTGQRLCVKPLHWTPKHLRALNMEFVPCKGVPEEPRNGTKEDEEEAQEGGCPSPARKHLTEDQLTNCVRRRDSAIHDVLWDPVQDKQYRAIDSMADMICEHRFYHDLKTVKLPLYYCRTRISDLKTNLLFSCAWENTPNCLAYIYLDDMISQRAWSLEQDGWKGGWANLTTCTRRGYTPLVRPVDAVHDAYIAAVLIALAQGIQRQTSDRESYKAFVWASAPRTHYLYTADIPLQFLRRLDRPSLRSVAERVPIDYYTLPSSEPREITRALSWARKELRRSYCGSGNDAAML